MPQGVASCRVPGDVRNHRGTPHQFKDPHPVTASSHSPVTPHPVQGEDADARLLGKGLGMLEWEGVLPALGAESGHR